MPFSDSEVGFELVCDKKHSILWQVLVSMYVYVYHSYN